MKQRPIYNLFRSLFIVFPLIFINACASNSQLQLADETVTYELSYGFYDTNLDKIPAPQSDQALTLYFPAIPGSLYGAITREMLQTLTVSADTFNLVLPVNVDSSAEPLNTGGFSVKPASTKMLRLGTFHSYPSYGQQFKGGGFINANNNTPLMLVYFSQASEVSGTLKSGDETFNHQISIQKAGWQWLHLIELSKNSYLLARYDGPVSNIVFTVLNN